MQVRSCALQGPGKGPRKESAFNDYGKNNHTGEEKKVVGRTKTGSSKLETKHMIPELPL